MVSFEMLLWYNEIQGRVYMESIKKYIPNILTSMRLILTPIIIYLGLTNHYKILIALAVVTALTDAIDGFLARKWQVTSDLGAKLDAIADKTLAIGLLIILIIKNHAFFYVLILESLIGILNVYFFFRKGVAASLLVGKFKTWIIFITIILGFVGIVFPPFDTNLFIYITVGLQIVTLISYLIFGIQTTKVKKKDLNNGYLEFYQIIEPILLTGEMQKRKDYPHHINESVYAHVLRVSYDCYRIGKQLGMDYKALTIAGLLHDFYEKPWQYNTEKKPFLQNHAFTHAKEAVLNSKKIYGAEIVTPKVESIMITHMFPLNRKIPRNKEAWLLTLIDKADSIDFILHPVALSKILFHKDIEKQKEKVAKKFKKLIKAKSKKNATVK